MKKFFTFLNVVFFVFLPFVVLAGGPFYAQVNIVSIEQKTSEVEVVASNVDTSKWSNIKFAINNDRQNEQLAVLLTAMAAGKDVGLTYTTQPQTVVAVKILN